MMVGWWSDCEYDTLDYDVHD